MKIDLNLRLESCVHAGFWKRGVKWGAVWEGYGWCDAEISRENYTFYVEKSLENCLIESVKGFQTVGAL